MATLSAFHSTTGRMDFLGLRSTRQGGLEIVYDDGGARRIVWRVSSGEAGHDGIGDAMRFAVTQPRVVSALHEELKRRSIVVEAVGS